MEANRLHRDPSISQTFGDTTCHPWLREGSGSTDAYILPLRYAQGFGSCAQDDSLTRRAAHGKSYLQMSANITDLLTNVITICYMIYSSKQYCGKASEYNKHQGSC